MTNQNQLTIKDIAKQLNLSKSTVSRALRDTYDVNPETRFRVLELAKELDFEPNTVAMSLRQHKTFNIGVVIPSFLIPFYSTAISGIQEVASAAGYNVMICQSNDSYETEILNVNSLVKSRIDGLIISLSKHTYQYEHIRKLSLKGLPTVMFNRVTDDLDLPSVTVNDYQSAYLATEYLISTGCCKIAHISGPISLQLSQHRKSGYLDCLKKHQLPVLEDWIMESDFSIESGIKAAEILLKIKKLPDAIFCVCDAVAFGLMITLKKQGVKIPLEISIMGFTNEPVASLVNPPLTTVSQPISEIGKKAAELLFKQINGKFTKWDKKNIVLETTLIIRESTR